jgi:hypothetical protein
MIVCVAALLAAAPLAGLLPPQATAPLAVLPASLADRGTFEISAGGRQVGTESFEIKVHGNQIEAQGEAHLEIEKDGKKIEVRTTSNLLLDSKFDPLSYTWSQKGTQSSQLSIDFRVDPVQVRYKTVGGQQDRRDFKLEKDVAILDDNVIHHYQLVLARYDATTGGTQAFRAFIPQDAAPGVVTLKALGSEPVTVDGRSRRLQHFALTAEQAQISLWADDQGHLQLVTAPDAQFQAMRR